MIAKTQLVAKSVQAQPKIQASPKLGESLLKQAEKFMTQWNQGERVMAKQLAKVPRGARSLLDAQMLMHKVHFESEIMTRVVDTLSSTVRRLQQAGSN